MNTRKQKVKALADNPGPPLVRPLPMDTPARGSPSNPPRLWTRIVGRLEHCQQASARLPSEEMATICADAGLHA